MCIWVYMFNHAVIMMVQWWKPKMMIWWRAVWSHRYPFSRYEDFPNRRPTIVSEND